MMVMMIFIDWRVYRSIRIYRTLLLCFQCIHCFGSYTRKMIPLSNIRNYPILQNISKFLRLKNCKEIIMSFSLFRSFLRFFSFSIFIVTILSIFRILNQRRWHRQRKTNSTTTCSSKIRSPSLRWFIHLIKLLPLHHLQMLIEFTHLLFLHRLCNLLFVLLKILMLSLQLINFIFQPNERKEISCFYVHNHFLILYVLL